MVQQRNGEDQEQKRKWKEEMNGQGRGRKGQLSPCSSRRPGRGSAPWRASCGGYGRGRPAVPPPATTSSPAAALTSAPPSRPATRRLDTLDSTVTAAAAASVPHPQERRPNTHAAVHTLLDVPGTRRLTLTQTHVSLAPYTPPGRTPRPPHTTISLLPEITLPPKHVRHTEGGTQHGGETVTSPSPCTAQHKWVP